MVLFLDPNNDSYYSNIDIIENEDDDNSLLYSPSNENIKTINKSQLVELVDDENCHEQINEKLKEKKQSSYVNDTEIETINFTKNESNSLIAKKSRTFLEEMIDSQPNVKKLKLLDSVENKNEPIQLAFYETPVDLEVKIYFKYYLLYYYNFE